MNHLEHPYAWLDLNALDENIHFVNQACGEKFVRIATKSVRNVEALRYIEKHLHNCAGFMTFTAAETLYLLEEGFNHLLIGYPVMEPNSVKKLLHASLYKDVVFMVDSMEHVQFLNRLASEMQCEVRVCLDINVSTDYSFLYFGTKRSPLTTLEKVQALVYQLKKLSCIQVVGVMTYDAQIAGVTDRFDGRLKSGLVQLLKKNSKKTLSSFRKNVLHFLHQQFSLEFINAGGSGSMEYSRTQTDITEITVGSAFFAPALFDRYVSLQLRPAAGYACRVVRQFDDETFILHGGGYVASGAIGLDKQPVFLEAERFSFTALEGAGEVQSPIIDKEKKLKIGDTVHLRHAKAGELCERFLTLHTFRGQQYFGPWSTYRGDGKCFL